MNQSYELMYILRPNLGEEQVRQEIAKYQDLLTERGATNIQVSNLGKKHLAYPIKKLQDGIYVQVNYQADGTQVAPLEKAMRLSDEVIRYLTLKLDSTSSTTEAESEEAVTTEEAAASEA